MKIIQFKLLGFSIIILSLFIFSGCTQPLVKYQKQTEEVSLKINDNKRYDITLHNPIYKKYGGKCIQKEYTLEDKKNIKHGHIFIYHATLSPLCMWSGLPEGFLLDNVRKNTAFKELERIENEKIKNYEFSKFKGFDKYGNFLNNIYLIEMWGADQNTFIFEEHGILYKDLKEALKKSS